MRAKTHGTGRRLIRWAQSVSPSRLILLRWILLASAGYLGASPALGGGGPENVAVVVNANSWASKTIANEFIYLRGIPGSHVIYLDAIPDFERVGVNVFRDSILVPAMQTLWERGLLEQIDYLIYSADLPTAVDLQDDIGDVQLAQPFKPPVASINGLTFLYPMVMSKRPLYLQLNTNFYMRRSTSALNSMPRGIEDKQAYAQGTRLAAEKKWDEAVAVLSPLRDKYPDHQNLLYNLACCLAQLGRADEALQAMDDATVAGWSDAAHAKRDDDLESLRKAPGFERALQKMILNKNKPVQIQESIGFRSVYQWNDLGERVNQNGIRYMLSTVLAVTSGRGNSVSEVIRSLRRSVAADGTRPAGTVYFMENSDIRSVTRQGLFSAAIEALKGTGVNGVVEKGKLPAAKSDVCGTMAGSSSFDWASSKSTMLPGAISENLTSFGGMMGEGAGQTPLTEFIRFGAAGSSGTVAEPYAIQAKFPEPFLHAHYAKGCSLAEAFYQSLAGPYQLLIVGDPLCQPWAKQLTVEVGGLPAEQPLSGIVTLEPQIAGIADASTAVKHFEAFIDGKRLKQQAPGARFTLNTASLSDGWHELRIVAVAKGPIETQSRAICPIQVDNLGKRATLSLADASSTAFAHGTPVPLRIEAPGASSVAVAHNGQVVGGIQGARGSLDVDTRTLGFGNVKLQAVAEIDGNQVLSEPLNLAVVPAPARQGAVARQLAEGLELSVEGGKPVVLTELKAKDWLKKQNVKSGQAFALRAWFEASADDIYQFQIRGNAVSQLDIDGQRLWPVDGRPQDANSWHMIPVHLAKGLHAFELGGTGTDSPSLEIRFGGPGCQTIDGIRFRH